MGAISSLSCRKIQLLTLVAHGVTCVYTWNLQIYDRAAAHDQALYATHCVHNNQLSCNIAFPRCPSLVPTEASLSLLCQSVS